MGKTVDEATSESRVIIRVEYVSKRYGGIKALSNVSPKKLADLNARMKG